MHTNIDTSDQSDTLVGVIEKILISRVENGRVTSLFSRDWSISRSGDDPAELNLQANPIRLSDEELLAIMAAQGIEVEE